MSIFSTYDDDILLEELKAGNEQAFTSIYQRYWQKLYVLAYRKLVSRPAAEDVVHEVFASLWKNKEKTEIRSLYAYLAAATRYAIYNELAKYEKQINTPAPGLSGTDTSFYEVIDIRFLRQMIDEEVNLLPEKCRLVFQYSRHEGLSNKEIAHKMAISEKAVEKHITKAISRLRQRLHRFLHFLFI